MFDPTQLKRNAQRKKTDPRVSMRMWPGALIGFLLLGSLIGPVFRQAKAQPLTITLTVTTTDQGCIVPLENYPITFNDRTLTTRGTEVTRDLQISPGQNQISISLPDKPRVKVAKVVVGTSEENSQPYFANDEGIATVDVNGNLGQPTVIVYLSGLCGEDSKDDEKEKAISVIVFSDDCKSSPQWSEIEVLIGNRLFRAQDAKELPKAKDSLIADTTITPGPQRIRLPNPPSAFRLTKIEYVCLVKQYTDTNKFVGDPHAPDTSGQVALTLDKSLWEKNKRFLRLALYIELSGNCADPKTEPQEFAIVTVRAVSGDVEVESPLEKQNEIEPRSKKANVGDTYESGTIIKTGNDGLILIESEYKHTITIENSTQVRLNELMTPTGRKQLTAFLKAGKIKVERHGSDLSGDSPQATIQTDTAAATSPHTVYSVSYDKSTKLTTVSVDEGQVKVYPENETLQTVTLTANQQVQVSDKKVIQGGISFQNPTLLLYVGIGIGGLVGLIILLVVIYMIYRLMKPATVRTAVQPARQSHRPRLQPGERPCPNPRCRALMPTTTNFCGVCGTTLP